jgi:hypothetical protein
MAWRDAYRNRYELPFVGLYDSGDVDRAQTPSGPAALVVLPKGSSTFSAVTLNDRFDGESDMHWDGTYMDLVAFNEEALLRFSISGNNGVVAGKVNLKHAYSVNHFFLDDSRLIISDWGYHRGLDVPSRCTSRATRKGRLERSIVLRSVFFKWADSKRLVT